MKRKGYLAPEFELIDFGRKEDVLLTSNGQNNYIDYTENWGGENWGNPWEESL